jgi:hypothetical protein
VTRIRLRTSPHRFELQLAQPSRQASDQAGAAAADAADAALRDAAAADADSRAGAALGHGQQRQLVHQAHRLVQTHGQRGDIHRACGTRALEILDDGTAHALQARLVLPHQALLGLFQRGQQRLDAAGDGALLHRHADRRFDIGQHVLVARSRQRLDQLLELRASSSAILAAASREVSCAWRASNCASVAIAPLSSWRLTSCCSSSLTRCCVPHATHSAAAPSRASKTMASAVPRPAPEGDRMAGEAAVGVVGSITEGRIVSSAPRGFASRGPEVSAARVRAWCHRGNGRRVGRRLQPVARLSAVRHVFAPEQWPD